MFFCGTRNTPLLRPSLARKAYSSFKRAYSASTPSVYRKTQRSQDFWRVPTSISRCGSLFPSDCPIYTFYFLEQQGHDEGVHEPYFAAVKESIPGPSGGTAEAAPLMFAHLHNIIIIFIKSWFCPSLWTLLLGSATPPSRLRTLQKAGCAWVCSSLGRIPAGNSYASNWLRSLCWDGFPTWELRLIPIMRQPDQGSQSETQSDFPAAVIVV